MDRATPVAGYPDSSAVPGDWSDEGPLDLLSGAALLGARAFVEHEMHAVVGGWATDADDGATVVFDALAQHHAWRSEVLVARLPHLRELPPPTVVVAPGPATGELLSTLRILEGDDARLGAWSAVAGVLLAVYDDLLRRCTPVADAPLQRWLPLLSDSLAADSLRAGSLTAGRSDAAATGGPTVDDLLARTERFTR